MIPFPETPEVEQMYYQRDGSKMTIRKVAPSVFPDIWQATFDPPQAPWSSSTHFYASTLQVVIERDGWVAYPPAMIMREGL